MIVYTPSRIHLGIIDLSREFPREYGALGAMVKGGYCIAVNSTTDRLTVEGASSKEKNELQNIYVSIKEKYSLEAGFKVSIKKSVPRHIGLGSTTQLKMGTAAAMLKEVGLNYDIKDLASTVGRSRFSAIGTYGFIHGGFILEGGKGTDEVVPPLTAHIRMPSDWRFVIVWPDHISSCDEVQEKPMMKSVKVSSEYPRCISHHVVMGVLPSLIEEDIESFGHHISQIQRLVGESFAPYQGGTFHPAVSQLVDKLEELTYGSGQSSWGPTAYGITTVKKAENTKEQIIKWLEKKDKTAEVWIAEPNNEGAVFTSHP
ncbi:MAG: hypothetical protein R6U17_01875 [Thermoplasmata archaeon]